MGRKKHDDPAAIQRPPERPNDRRPRRHPQAGGTAVEFALVLPLFCAMLFGTIDYGWYFYQKYTLCAALQSGIRAAVSVRESDNPDPWAAAKKATQDYLDAGGAIPSASVTIGPLTNQYGGTKPSRYLILTGSYTITPLVGFIVPLPSKTISYSTTMMLDAENAQI